MLLKDNFKKISERVSESAEGRLLRLVAVSKLQPVEKIQQLIELGHFDFGENYQQELAEKKLQINNENVRWHFVGSLQSKKINKIVGEVELIHSVETLGHLTKINSVAQAKGLTQPVLLQVNIADEETKSGFSVSELESLLPEFAALAKVDIQGLMAMPPHVENAEGNRKHFRALKNLLDKLCPNMPNSDCFNQLSMGTSSDFEVAIEEGATIIRIGTELMGPRE